MNSSFGPRLERLEDYLKGIERALEKRRKDNAKLNPAMEVLRSHLGTVRALRREFNESSN